MDCVFYVEIGCPTLNPKATTIPMQNFCVDDPVGCPGGDSSKHLRPGSLPIISSWLPVFQNAAGTQPERWKPERASQVH